VTIKLASHESGKAKLTLVTNRLFSSIRGDESTTIEGRATYTKTFHFSRLARFLSYFMLQHNSNKSRRLSLQGLPLRIVDNWRI